MRCWSWLALVAGAVLMTGVVRIPASLFAEDPPIELGAVAWGRDLETARGASAKTGKPVMVLFQEVPG